MHLEQRSIDDALAHLLRPTWCCVDAGAHIGSSVAKLVRHCPHGHHLAIEPVPTKAAWLRKRYPQVEVHQFALGDEPGRHEFFENHRRSGFSGVQSSLDAFGYERTDIWDLLTDAGYDLYLAQDHVFGRDPMGRDEFRRAGTYPFPGFNYFACPVGTPVTRLR
jgi:hypothetical protein